MRAQLDQRYICECRSLLCVADVTYSVGEESKFAVKQIGKLLTCINENCRCFKLYYEIPNTAIELRMAK